MLTYTYDVVLFGFANTIERVVIRKEEFEGEPIIAEIMEAAEDNVHRSLCHQCGHDVELGDEWEAEDHWTGKPHGITRVED
jgi:hypothetical protein